MQGAPSHLDLCVVDPRASIPFYDTLLSSLGYTRARSSEPDWQKPNPTRAAWGIRYPDGTTFGIDLRPASSNTTGRYGTYDPGPHHLALQADSDAAVDRVHRAMQRDGWSAADPPFNYGGQPGYGEHYYAVFFIDPDGFKLEVVYAMGFGP
jgi:catechol 2,3-dioxygenase-like lactoylglutathione lyase family enzyme